MSYAAFSVLKNCSIASHLTDGFESIQNSTGLPVNSFSFLAFVYDIPRFPFLIIESRGPEMPVISDMRFCFMVGILWE